MRQNLLHLRHRKARCDSFFRRFDKTDCSADVVNILEQHAAALLVCVQSPDGICNGPHSCSAQAGSRFISGTEDDLAEPF